MLFDPRKGQWWNAEDKRLAYYMTLRVHYEMGALEAWQYMKRAHAEYPEFMSDPIGVLREAVNRSHK